MACLHAQMKEGMGKILTIPAWLRMAVKNNLCGTKWVGGWAILFLTASSMPSCKQ